MAKIQCKMCGGELDLPENVTYGTCCYCGLKITLPKVSDERLENLYNRAEHFRRINDYSKAVKAYEEFITANPEDSEAYWGLVLSRYGIEYVEDPASHERIPTCHRVSYESILADADYLSALEYAGYAERQIYETEAKRIAEIQKGILAISSQEQPFDVFICYKESDDYGKRTKDSVIAQDLYYSLTDAGYKVFFARVTLESKLGQQYEPYIFAALNSAKVMLVVGSKKEYFEAVWVRNEWSRYLELMKKDRKRLLIPCYRDMDAYDIPEELSLFQAQDMGRIGFVQDVLRGIQKVCKKEEAKPETGGNPSAAALLTRAEIMISAGDFENAKSYLQRFLDQDPKNGWGYFNLILAELKLTDRKMLINVPDIRETANFKLAKQFADDKLKEILNQIIQEQEEIKRKAEEERRRWEEEQRRLAEEQRRLAEEQRKAEEERRRLEAARAAWMLKQKEKKRLKIVATAVAVFVLIVFFCFIPTIIDHCRGYRIENGVLVEVLDKTRTEFFVPDGVTSIGYSAFSGCSNLSSVTIPNSVTSIGKRAFSGCSNLSSVTIPNSVTSIGESAFMYCSNLSSVTIPNSVTSIGKYAFSDCSKLTIYAKDKSVLPKDYNGALHIIIPNSVTSIGKYAFSGCSKLSSVTIPNSVTSIGDSAFSRCSNLRSVTIPNSVRSIGMEAFSGCGLTRIKIPDSVTSIGESAFSDCKNLRIVTIPQNCKFVESGWGKSFPYNCNVFRRD